MQKPSQLPSDVSKLADLWLDGASPTEVDLRAASNLSILLASFDGLRPFSAVVERLVEQLARPDFALDDVCKVIELDPALASRILRVANSAAYRGFGPCASVVQAVVRIGGANVSGIVMAMSAMAMFRDVGGVGRQIRDHSAGTAVVARELAICLDQPGIASRVFLAGLLHDIGKLLLMQTGAVGYATLVARELSPSSLHLKEQAMWGFDHGMLGAHVLKSWNVPAPIPQLVAWHHHPKGGQCSATGLAPALDLLRLADVIDWLLAQGCAADSAWVARLASSPDGVRAGLAADTLPAVWQDLRAIRDEALQVFDFHTHG